MIREEQADAFKKPTILQLRTAGLNPNMGGHRTASEWSFLTFCLYYCYSDVERACALYESAAEENPGLLDYVFVDPPALHDAEGTVRTGHKLLSAEMQKT